MNPEIGSRVVFVEKDGQWRPAIVRAVSDNNECDVFVLSSSETIESVPFAKEATPLCWSWPASTEPVLRVEALESQSMKLEMDPMDVTPVSKVSRLVYLSAAAVAVVVILAVFLFHG